MAPSSVPSSVLTAIGPAVWVRAETFDVSGVDARLVITMIVYDHNGQQFTSAPLRVVKL